MNFFKVGISRSAILYVFLAVIIGGLIGIVDAIFGRGLIYITEFRDSHALYLIHFNLSRSLNRLYL